MERYVIEINKSPSKDTDMNRESIFVKLVDEKSKED